jgi:cell cycle arrest protein BUB3
MSLRLLFGIRLALIQAQARKYAFKCHRKKVNGVQTLYPVNALAFNPVHGTFASGGCDGTVCVWDGQAKKRICQYPSCETSISALAFNSYGSMLAIAQSYTFENGEKDHPRYIQLAHARTISTYPDT